MSGVIFSKFKALPAPHDDGMVQGALERLGEAAQDGDYGATQLQSLLESSEPVRNLVTDVFGASPYLTNLIIRNAQLCCDCLTGDPDAITATQRELLSASAGEAADQRALQAVFRRAKARNALLVALSDVAGYWTLDQVTGALTRFADDCLSAAVNWLLLEAEASGKLSGLNENEPSEGCGYVVLAMGKHGAFELNYSSDIDIIVLFDPETAPMAEGVEPSIFFVRLTKRLAALLQEPTEDGYALRVDLRLRPDPRATQVAIAIEAAATYYENMGQNWERAAMIKARAAAGDLALGEEFLSRMKPYVWRKYLDFAAIADVQSLKRQIHAVKGHGEIAVAGHNVKLGRGGIREIEFFVQTQQLIAGGRNPALRGRRTVDMLHALAEEGWIDAATADELNGCYDYLRTIEHRVQMVGDEQTHTLPKAPEDLERFARFCGSDGAVPFTMRTLGVLKTVQDHYAALFESAGDLGTETGSLSFTGGEDDPETLETLADLGFEQPAEMSAIIRGWHFGRYGATRSAVARERLTELMPSLLSALSRTGDPSGGLIAFDRFLAGLPAGVQLFSLLAANVQLLDLLATLLGTAPRLAEQLSRQAKVLDAVLDPGFFSHLPGRDEIDTALSAAAPPDTGFEEVLDLARIIGKEFMFRAGVRIVSETIRAVEAGSVYSDIADALVTRLLAACEAELEARHGRVPGGAACVLAMGKLGGREMTAASDLDLILIYDHEPDAMGSDGAKPLSPGQYYARLTQRLIAALSSPTSEGTLYEVDMRLRPSGNKGPVATHIDSFTTYHVDSAWTWEKLALTRARVVAGDGDLHRRIDTAIRDALCVDRDETATRADITKMRALMIREHGGGGIWNLKHARGGLVEVEFIVQFLEILNAADKPEVLARKTAIALDRLADLNLLGAGDFDILKAANRLYHRFTQVLRLCVEGTFEPPSAPDGLKRLLCNAAEVPDFAQLEAHLEEAQEQVAEIFDRLIGEPDNAD